MTTKASVIKAHIRDADIARLEEIFAVRKEHGWVIPEWLTTLKNSRDARAMTRTSSSRKTIRK